MKKINKYKFGKTSNTRRKNVSKYLNLCAELALSCSPVDFGVPVNGGFRFTQQQQEIFHNGWSKCDGIIKKSFHQKVDLDNGGQAIDLVPYIKGIGFSYKAKTRFGVIGILMINAWDELQEQGKIPKDIYLHWGGFWGSRKKYELGWDLAHFEIRDYVQQQKTE